MSGVAVSLLPAHGNDTSHPFAPAPASAAPRPFAPASAPPSGTPPGTHVAKTTRAPGKNRRTLSTARTVIPSYTAPCTTTVMSENFISIKVSAAKENFSCHIWPDTRIPVSEAPPSAVPEGFCAPHRQTARRNLFAALLTYLYTHTASEYP